MSDYTVKYYNLDEVSDFQPLKDDLQLTAVGLTLVRMEPGEGYPYFHKHQEQEEIYICIKGTGTMLVGGDEIKMKAGSFVRVSADVPRAVGNRTKKPCTFLIAGGLPSEKYRDDRWSVLIEDSVKLEGILPEPDWTVK
jgi:mannose-6-phosphate isomerase-like protein (cupin superfamily)